MTVIEARNMAQKYTTGMGEVLPGFIFGLGDPEEFYDKFYFDLVFLTLSGEQPLEPPVAGGARGVVVEKRNKEVRPVSHAEYASIVNNQTELEETYEAFIMLKQDKRKLSFIKDKYKLSSSQLLNLIKTMESTDLVTEQTFDTLNKLIEGVKDKS